MWDTNETAALMQLRPAGMAPAELLAIATRAVELTAARGGAMTAEDIANESIEVGGPGGWPDGGMVDRLIRSHTVQGARIAVLEAEVSRLRASADELQRQRDSRGEALEVLEAEKHRALGEMEIAQKETISARAERDALKAELAMLKEAGSKVASAYLRLKSPAPSESSAQVAEDEKVVRGMIVLLERTQERPAPRTHAALSRLAAGALQVDAIRKRSLDERSWGAVHQAALDAGSDMDAIRAVLRCVVDGPQCVACGEEPATTLEQDPPALGAKCAAAVSPSEARDCTCLGTCKGAAGLAPGWRCAKDWPKRLGKPSAARYPYSPTCTRDDAATPGHPERVKKRSEAVKAVGECPPSCPSHLSSGHTHGVAEDTSHRKVNQYGKCRHNEHWPICQTCNGYEDGAEAMRAACLEAVQQVLYTEGEGTSYQRIKAAIEGATP
jgi:hypothetical protein